MTPAEMDVIRQRCEKATPGPWDCISEKGNRLTTDDGDVGILSRGAPLDTWGMSTFIGVAWHDRGAQNAAADAEFIAHARSDIPALLAEIERMQVERMAIRHRVERLLLDSGFSTPAILRILDPLFHTEPDAGRERAPKKHADCVAAMCGKIDCGRVGPCYAALPFRRWA